MECCGKNIATNNVKHENKSLHKEKWVDIAKGLAILAVITDHLESTLYSSEIIRRLSFFSVTLFILVMGVTTYWSYNNSKIPLWKKVILRIGGIFVPYVVAGFICTLFSDHFFAWDSFYYNIVHFKIAGPYYYVLLYIQLLLISPVMFLLIKELESIAGFRKNAVIILVGVVLGVFARVSNLYTDISGIYASKLFGGSYILCLYIGMLVGMTHDKIKNMPKPMKNGFGLACLVAVITIIYAIVSKGLIFDKTFLLGTDINPPGITLLLFAITIMLSLCIWNAGTRTNCLFWPLEFIGKHSLYIFLYHFLIMDLLNIHVDLSLRWIKIPLYYATMIGASIIIEIVLTKCKKVIIKGYLYRKEC